MLLTTGDLQAVVCAAEPKELCTNTHAVMKLNKEIFPRNVGTHGRYDEYGEKILWKCVK